MTYATAFPDFPASDIPSDIPPAWSDSSWHNDACPSFTVCGPEVTSARLVMWINYSDKSLSELPDAPRYMLADGANETLFESDDWAEFREMAERHRLAYEFARSLADSMDSADWAAMRERNRTVPAGVCASHDFRDSNMDMQEAYESTFGETVFDGDHIRDSVFDRWNQAWQIATPRYLTADTPAARTFDAWRKTRGAAGTYGPGQIDKFQVTGQPLRHCVTVANYSEAFESLFEAELVLWELFASKEWESVA